MLIISGKDILINARQESIQMRHHFLGVEHIFIAMLQIQGGITSSILEDHGLTPSYVVDAIRRKTDKGSNQRLWAGFPYTPRTEVVLDIAQDLAAENGEVETTERELLVAILTESDSLPIRVIQQLGVNIRAMTLAAVGYSLKVDPQPPDVAIIFTESFSKDSVQREHLFVLRRMFTGHSSIRIERKLTGFSGALVIVVTPVQADGQEDAPVVVKIHEADLILDEVHRYETHVKSVLPLQTARLEDNPVAPDSSTLAGIKYTLVSNAGGIPVDLRTRTLTQNANDLGNLLQKELYARFNKTWWQQKKPFRFQAWKEYDWLLPPLITLDYVPEGEVVDTAFPIKVPINRSKLKSRIEGLSFGTDVSLENFTVQKIDSDRNILRLAVGFGSEADKRAYRIDVRGVNHMNRTFFRGEVVEKISGSVWKTRHDFLVDAVRDLEPHFDIMGTEIVLGDLRWPNPLTSYNELLERYVNGSMSKIHGDLNLGNILVGPSDTMWLIDFGSTRDGHTVFDWATLEVSLLCDRMALEVDVSWDYVGTTAHVIAGLNDTSPIEALSEQLFTTMAAVTRIREIVRSCLNVANHYGEYYIALAFCSLRAISWKSMSLGGRRLAYLISAIALMNLENEYAAWLAPDGSSANHADITEHLPSSIPFSDHIDD